MTLNYDNTYHIDDLKFYSNAKKPAVISKRQYLVNVNQLISELKNKAFEKIVYSRVIAQPITKSATQIFEDLCLAYPRAFVYLMSVENYGTWIGASPESFIDLNHKTLRTTSLAGTKTDRDSNWGNKEREEQNIVSKFILEELKKVNASKIEKTGPYTFDTGAVLHLKTDFSCEIENKSVKNLIKKLHPTPATCGIPQKKTSEIISEIEPHDRLLYTGFLGPTSENRANLFVNLRCMQIINNMAYLYVGGGITADSIAELEWEETKNKAKTLLQFIN